MKIRKFRLINNDGQEYHLTEREHFLHSPAGLGYAKETEYQRLGDLHVILDDAFAQEPITGDVFFPNPGAYDKYFQFVRFCQNTPLYLLYQPSEKEYRRQVVVSRIEKSEIENGGLNISITFDFLTLFYELFSLYGDKSEAEDGKIYDYTYDYRYSDNAANTLELVCDSYAESPCTIFIYGEAINPTWRHYVNNVLYATGTVNTTIPEGQKLAIDTTQIPYSLKRVDGANRLVADVYGASDFSTERFIMLQNGTNRITVSHEGANALTVSMEAHVLYASV